MKTKTKKSAFNPFIKFRHDEKEARKIKQIMKAEQRRTVSDCMRFLINNYKVKK